MKPTIFATIASTLALAGCASTGEPDYVARTSPEPESRQAPKTSSHEALDARIAYHAKAYKLPESLVHAVVRRESKYDPSLKHGRFWGLMQIRYDTARSMGYTGAADGLLDPETNLTYAVAYLANAFRIAGGDAQRAIRLYANGYYYEAKRQGLLGEIRAANLSNEIQTASSDPTPEK
jgi:soluble lytic murein transglycosylase-like protein